MLGIVLALLPVFAHAGILSNVSATSDTGGNGAGQGGTVTTGASSASVQVQTLSGSAGGTSTVRIKTVTNGKKYEETFTRPAGSIGVSVVATSSGYETRVWEPGTSGATSTTPVRFIERISSWFARIFSFFGWR